MSQPLPPMITVCSGDIRRTYPPGRDVIVGRDVRADIRIPHPAISRAHVILRCVDGHWTAIDNDSLNGMFVGVERVKSTTAGDGTVLHLGNPEGPALTFELGPPPDERPTVETERPDRAIAHHRPCRRRRHRHLRHAGIAASRHRW